MTKKSNNTLIQKIVANIPNHIKPVDYMIEQLKISRESAYRRLRGQIPFTFCELSQLSTELGFSVDEVIMNNNKEGRAFFNVHVKRALSPDEGFFSMLLDYQKYLDPVLVKNTNSRELFASINRLGLHLLIEFDSLFKLFYYKWLRLTNCSSVNIPFSEVNVPDEALDIRDQIRSAMSNLDSINYIIDKNIFRPLIQEIQYHRSRKLISKEEIKVLKKDMLRLLANMEDIMSKGIDESNKIKYTYYLSLMGVEANTSCVVCGKNTSTLYWLFSLNATIIKNHEIAYLYKLWFNSIKKQSVLITQSNEIQQIEFINAQRDSIEKIDENLVFY
jgi:hypothetical protein